MQRVTRSTAVATMPDPPVEGTPGYFTGGDPQSGQAATVPGFEWHNRVTEELCYVIEQAGLTLSNADNTQLRQAIQAMIANAQKAIIITGATFEASVADGEVVRWDAGNSRFDEAIADGTSNNLAVGIADVTNGKVYCYGECGLFSGLTPGGRYYLSGTTAGAITTTAPSDKVMVGIAKSATVLWVDIDAEIAPGLRFRQEQVGAINANTTLTVAMAGQTFEVTGAWTVTLPPLAGLPDGCTYTLKAAAAFTLQGDGSELIDRGEYSANTYSILAGQTITVVRNANAWYAVMEGFGSSSFLASLAGNGYQRLPGGLILQWGSFVSHATPGNPVAVTFPIAFPIAIYSLALVGGRDNTSPMITWYSNVTTTGFQGRSDVAGNGVFFIAIGK